MTFSIQQVGIKIYILLWNFAILLHTNQYAVLGRGCPRAQSSTPGFSRTGQRQPSRQQVAPRVKRLRIGHGRIENNGSALGWHPVLSSADCRGYTGSRSSLMTQTQCHRDTLLVTSNNTQGNGGRPPFHAIFHEKLYFLDPAILV